MKSSKPLGKGIQENSPALQMEPPDLQKQYLQHLNEDMMNNNYVKSITRSGRQRGVRLIDGQENRTPVDVYNQHINALAEEYIRSLYKPRVAILAGYRGLNVGDVSNIGLNFSLLHPLGGIAVHVNDKNGDLKKVPHTPSALLFLFSAQDVIIQPADRIRRLGGDTYPTQASGVRYSAAIAWQDRVLGIARFDSDDNLDRKTRMDIIARMHWQVQTGVEFNFANAVIRENSYDAFVRYRPNLLTEYSATLGVREDHRVYLGGRISYTFF